jgi:formate-dependent nitrite reductase membrane component NrfD
MRPVIARYGALIAPVPVIVGTLFIIFELGRPFRALNLFKLINLSPMSIGSWVVGLFIVISIAYALTYILPSSLVGKLVRSMRQLLAWLILPFGFGLAVYTAILLGAMPARPFWNSPVIAMLFVLSALSGGIAIIMLALLLFHRRPGSAADHERSMHLLGGTDAMLLLGELLVILFFLLFAQLSIGSVKESVSVILPSGELGAQFWGLVVMIGILLPAGMELSKFVPGRAATNSISSARLFEFTAAALILIGGFALRYIVVVAGQITGPVGI